MVRFRYRRAAVGLAFVSNGIDALQQHAIASIGVDQMSSALQTGRRVQATARIPARFAGGGLLVVAAVVLTAMLSWRSSRRGVD